MRNPSLGAVRGGGPVNRGSIDRNGKTKQGFVETFREREGTTETQRHREDKTERRGRKR
jgi:hypothetical protein